MDIDTMNRIRKNGFIFSDTLGYPCGYEVQMNAIQTICSNTQRVEKLADNIKKVIFDDPATIIIWKNGTKTVVKSEGEDYDPEKGLAMAIAKKALGNEGNYYNVFKKWLPKNKDAEIVRTCCNCVYRKSYNEGEPCQSCDPNNGNKFFKPYVENVSHSVLCNDCIYWKEDVTGLHCLNCIGIPNHPNFVMRKGGNK